MFTTVVCAAPAAAFLPVPGQASAAEISAAALLRLMIRAEAKAANNPALDLAASPLLDMGPPASNNPAAQAGEPVNRPILSAYFQEQIETISAAVFNRVNGDFYRTYRQVGPEALCEIVLSKEDLRPLAYRAMMYAGPRTRKSRPFTKRFASSLLQLEKYWDLQFMHAYKDANGCISAQSLKAAGVTV